MDAAPAAGGYRADVGCGPAPRAGRSSDVQRRGSRTAGAHRRRTESAQACRGTRATRPSSSPPRRPRRGGGGTAAGAGCAAAAVAAPVRADSMRLCEAGDRLDVESAARAGRRVIDETNVYGGNVAAAAAKRVPIMQLLTAASVHEWGCRAFAMTRTRTLTNESWPGYTDLGSGGRLGPASSRPAQGTRPECSQLWRRCQPREMARAQNVELRRAARARSSQRQLNQQLFGFESASAPATIARFS